ncbi:protein O-GlcNAcase [Glaciibacter psychrotolerans]|uniref:Hyaluronoglucosaminidase n=1 Tax=Glaciibacter psychrotolerans TaxID=670054 RepID=A0A7Z0J4I5_9MICO|nr:protein O-GlcNAcase [Leifsonia psychrotolerans]NYJ18380.1 hyaluronoglucosaminidase [Leifsonia psychrotolerans]
MFAIRGVIEGFYGRPWTDAQRLELIEFVAARGMNTFVYAPKGDPLVREDWREPYLGEELTRLKRLVDQCRRHGVTFVYCLSPGLSIEYSSAADHAALTAKYDTVAALGVETFGLLLDDIPIDLQHPADRDAFTDLVEAHRSLIGTVFTHLGPTRSLIVCPTVYWGSGDEDYITRLGHGIDPRIDLFWSGRAICSATLDLADAALFARSTLRPVTYWDNYPVNDVAMGHELHIGPYQGRDRHLYRFATGVISNGMELFESSKIAFATIAEYLSAPEEYNAEESWMRALRDVVGDADLAAYALFADTVRSSCLSAEDAPALTRALDAFAYGYRFDDRHAAAAALADVAHRMQVAADHLLNGPVVNPALIAEARPWIESFGIGADALARVAELARENRLETDGPTELIGYLTALRAANRRVFGDLLDMTLAELTAPQHARHEIPAPPRLSTAKDAS